MANANPHPIMAKYGLESMSGDALEILERHLVNNHAATLGGYVSIANTLRGQLELVAAALHEWLAAEDELPLDGFSCACDLAADGTSCEHVQLAHDWMMRVEAARQQAHAALAKLPQAVLAKR